MARQPLIATPVAGPRLSVYGWPRCLAVSGVQHASLPPPAESPEIARVLAALPGVQEESAGLSNHSFPLLCALTRVSMIFWTGEGPAASRRFDCPHTLGAAITQECCC